jgi:alanyl-tRNA synthetase
MTDEEIVAAERRVNQLIRSDYALDEKRDATMDEAKAMGAIALFGEKYGDRVRVVKFGDSVELCGGTHAASTGRIGMFKIVSEGAVAAGVRRIEAVTGAAAEDLVYSMQDSLKAARAFFNNAPDLTGAIQKMVAENAGYKKEIEGFMKEKVAGLAASLSQNAETVGDIRLVRFTTSLDPATVREVAALLQKEAKGFVFAGAFEYEGKPQLVLMYSADLVAAGKNAGKDIRDAAKFIMGGGGGQPGLATAGGKNPEGLKEALEKMVETALAK